MLDGLGALAGTPVIEGHGDLHVGQVLRSGGRFVVTDFDGNPVLPARAADAADSRRPRRRGDGRSRWRTPRSSRASTPRLDPAALADVDAAGRAAFLGRLHAPARGTRPRRAVRPGSAARLPTAAGAARDHLRRKASPPVDVRARRGTARTARRRDATREARRFRRRPAPQARGAARGSPRRWRRATRGREVVPADVERVVLLGMGSSAYAGGVAAARMRARGLIAVLGTGLLATAPGVGHRHSRGGDVGQRRLGRDARCAGPAARRGAHGRVDEHGGVGDHRAVRRRRHLDAEPEVGGVACRSYQHTLALLMALECQLAGVDTAALAASVAAAADGVRTPDRHRVRLAPSDFRDCCSGPTGTHLAAPAHRFCSAQQGALMLREGPRLPAVGCETGDWSHVDVYLTKTTDYRLLVFAGSAWEPQLAEWTHGARQHRRRGRRDASRARGTTCATPATATTTSGCSPRCWYPNSSPRARGRPPPDCYFGISSGESTRTAASAGTV